MDYLLHNWQNLLGLVVTALVSVFGIGALIGLLPKLSGATEAGFEWLKAHAEIKGHEKVTIILQRTIVLVRTKVLEYENGAIEDLKEKAADGKLTKEELEDEYKKLSEKFRSDMKELLTLHGLWDVVKAFLGGGTEEGAFKVLDTLKNAAVAQLPASGLQTPKNQNELTWPATAMMAGEMKTKTPAEATTPVVPTVPPPAAP